MEPSEDIPEDAMQAILNEDWHTAYLIIHKMALLGNMNAEHFMGWFYEQGLEVEQSDVKAYEWWSKSASKGIVESQSALAQFYETGRGIEENYTQAYIWYSKAILNGDIESQILISTLSNKMSKSELENARKLLQTTT